MHLTHINSIHLHVLNKLLMSKGRDTIEDGFVAIALTRMSVNGLVIHGRITSKAKGNSYTIEFTDSSNEICFGNAEMFIRYQNEIYVLIRRLYKGLIGLYVNHVTTTCLTLWPSMETCKSYCVSTSLW